jgi:SAM-dependent methyltransferase
LTSNLDDSNRKAHEGSLAIRSYDVPTRGLFESEAVILDRLRPELIGKRLLDIGIGAGRTTPFLLEISTDYTGIDYSAPLVDRARNKFELNSIFQCDARDMRRFHDKSFDFVLFSFNGLDCISHEGRLKAVAEVNRVLKPGGIFMFSSHNRSYRNLEWERWGRGHALGTVAFFKECALQVLLMPRRYRMRRLEVIEHDYAMLNDSALRYLTLNYYISVQSQIRQLRSMNFELTEAYDSRGALVQNDDVSPWIYYVARKKAAPTTPIRRTWA